MFSSTVRLRKTDGSYEAYTDYGRQKTGVDAVEWAKRVIELGAGELAINSIDKEGTGHGFDLELVRRISAFSTIPVIACGGAGKIDDIREVIDDALADAVCLASILHYEAVKHFNYRKNDFLAEGNVEFLFKSENAFGATAVRIRDIKKALGEARTACRT